MKTIHFLLFATLFIFIFSCNKSGNSISRFDRAKTLSSQEKDKATIQDLQLVPPATNQKDQLNKTMDSEIADTIKAPSQLILQGTSPNTDWDKKIIKTAFLKLEVKDFKSYVDCSSSSCKAVWWLCC